LKARIKLTKNNKKRTIILQGNSLQITFHNNFEAEGAYTHLKNEMKENGWKSAVSKYTLEYTPRKSKVSKILGLPLKEKS